MCGTAVATTGDRQTQTRNEHAKLCRLDHDRAICVYGIVSSGDVAAQEPSGDRNAIALAPAFTGA